MLLPGLIFWFLFHKFKKVYQSQLVGQSVSTVQNNTILDRAVQEYMIPTMWQLQWTGLCVQVPPFSSLIWSRVSGVCLRGGGAVPLKPGGDHQFSLLLFANCHKTTPRRRRPFLPWYPAAQLLLFPLPPLARVIHESTVVYWLGWRLGSVIWQLGSTLGSLKVQ